MRRTVVSCPTFRRDCEKTETSSIKRPVSIMKKGVLYIIILIMGLNGPIPKEERTFDHFMSVSFKFLQQSGRPVPRRLVLPRCWASSCRAATLGRPAVWSRCLPERWASPQAPPDYRRNWPRGTRRWPGWWPGLPRTWQKPGAERNINDSVWVKETETRSWRSLEIEES